MRKRVIFLIMLVVIIIVIYGGFAYAVINQSKIQSATNRIYLANCLDISIDGEDEIDLNDAYPIRDSE